MSATDEQPKEIYAPRQFMPVGKGFMRAYLQYAFPTGAKVTHIKTKAQGIVKGLCDIGEGVDLVVWVGPRFTIRPPKEFEIIK